ncbi:STAS-like domain-containing protein [Butyricimonas muris]|uniref:STAS-like domain-containing protein n=1 Tax=Butyricimonas muris TaxID=3378067 RepID=UPI0039674B1B
MKNEQIVLKISDLTALDIAVSSDEGDKIYNRIVRILSEYEVLVLDFQGIMLLTTAFLNAAIGQLYKDYSSEELSLRLKLMNVNDDDLPLFKKVTDRAKEYFNNADSFKRTTNEILGSE